MESGFRIFDQNLQSNRSVQMVVKGKRSIRGVGRWLFFFFSFVKTHRHSPQIGISENADQEKMTSEESLVMHL